jgi:hypothetical protein
MDLGTSCAKVGASEAEAAALFATLSTDFRTCHADWVVSEDGDDSTRDVLAERGGDLRFVRLRAGGASGWEVSIGAMPSR